MKCKNKQSIFYLKLFPAIRYNLFHNVTLRQAQCDILKKDFHFYLGYGNRFQNNNLFIFDKKHYEENYITFSSISNVKK